MAIRLRVHMNCSLQRSRAHQPRLGELQLLYRDMHYVILLGFTLSGAFIALLLQIPFVLS